MRCVHCQSELDPNEAFCGNCGQPVPTASSAAPQSRSSHNWVYVAALVIIGVAITTVYFKGYIPASLVEKLGLKPNPTAQPTVTAQTGKQPTVIAPSPGGSPKAKATPRTRTSAPSPRVRVSPTPVVPPPFDPKTSSGMPPIMPRTQVRAVIQDPDGFTNVRAGPGLSYPIRAQILAGEIFTTTVSNNAWWQVTTKNGVVGYMHRSHIHLIE